METQANVVAVLAEAPEDGDEAAAGPITTLAIELDAIPGAVWQTELISLMPSDVRVSLFERGAQKCALLTFPEGQMERALEAFEQARQGANEVSQQAHQVAKAARASVGPATR
ncbi:MAG TPA: hypothetical protein VJN18_02500 [Polyangiaceae bacterium]|nr:hypothetical protein [Polyangiaceae bacterium]